MRVEKALSISTIVGLCVMLISLSSGSVYAQSITASMPQLAGGGVYVIGNSTAELQANVYSTYPIINVTLYYKTVENVQNPPPAVLAVYTPLKWNYSWGGTLNSTYVWLMPHFANNTLVYGFVEAFNENGDSYGNPSQRQLIYEAFTPNPNGSDLTISFEYGHLDPKLMTLNATLYATLTNYATYRGDEFLVIGTTSFGYLNMYQPAGLLSYSSGRQEVTMYYWQGVPEMYPFDSPYNFTYVLKLPSYLNQSGRITM